VSFEVAFPRRRQESRRDPNLDRWTIECLLLERVLVEGRPCFKTVKKLAIIAEDEVCALAAVERFWSAAMLKLGKPAPPG
jgi:hypothetical protein